MIQSLLPESLQKNSKTPIPDFNKQEKTREGNCIVVIKRRHDSKPEIVRENVSFHSGAKLSNILFKFFFLHQSAVVEVDTLGESVEERFNVVYKIESTCKHISIQDECQFEFERIVPKCLECNAVVPYNLQMIIDEVSIRKIEETLMDRMGNIKGLEG